MRPNPAPALLAAATILAIGGALTTVAAGPLGLVAYLTGLLAGVIVGGTGVILGAAWANTRDE